MTQQWPSACQRGWASISCSAHELETSVVLGASLVPKGPQDSTELLIQSHTGNLKNVASDSNSGSDRVDRLASKERRKAGKLSHQILFYLRCCRKVLTTPGECSLIR